MHDLGLANPSFGVGAATWNKRFAMLFVEQPVGTGFSEPGARHKLPAHAMYCSTVQDTRE